MAAPRLRHVFAAPFPWFLSKTLSRHPHKKLLVAFVINTSNTFIVSRLASFHFFAHHGRRYLQPQQH